MSHVEHEITINATPAQVFAALLDVGQAPKWMANLQEVRSITGRALGDSFEWTFRMAGLTFKGKTVFAAIEPNQYLREDGSGDLTNSWEWHLSPSGASTTHVRVGIEYTVPGGAVLGALANKLFVERQNDKDLQQSLDNLKRILEG